MRKYLYPYKMGSQSARNLGQALGAKRIKREGSRFRGSQNKMVINWGCGSLPDQVNACFVLNKPEAVVVASDKLAAFQALFVNNCDGDNFTINHPLFTTCKEQAQEWLDEDIIVVARTKLRGHSGDGIVICSRGEELVDAPLYVQYVKKTQEYRVHVVCGEVIDQQRKARRQDAPDEEVNWQVRNHQNGFIFMREGVDLPAIALDQALHAVHALGLDFGAVDLIYNQREDKYYVLEINTAPGLTGTTLEKYAEVFDGF